MGFVLFGFSFVLFCFFLACLTDRQTDRDGDGDGDREKEGSRRNQHELNFPINKHGR